MTQPERFHRLPDEAERESTRERQEFEAMYKRLVDYGLCYLRAGTTGMVPVTIIKIKVEGEDDRFERVHYRDPEPDKKPRQWSMLDIEKAARLHSRIIRLPRVVHRMVIQVFFNETVAEGWHKIDPQTKTPVIDPRAKPDVLRDMTNWNGQPKGVNARLRDYNADQKQSEPLIHWTQFEPILHRGIKILCNNERMLP